MSCELVLSYLMLLVNTVCQYSVNGRVRNALIYRRGSYYGSLNNEKYTSIEHFVTDLSRKGFTLDEGATSVTLTNPLFPDK